jgi:hypothetical protein
MVDDQINHQLEAGGVGLRSHLLHLILGRCAVALGQKSGIEAEIIGNRVKAAGSAQLLDGVDKRPIEAQLSGALKVLLPIGKSPR